MSYIDVYMARNQWLVEFQPLKLAVSPSFEAGIGNPDNMITLCEGNVITLCEGNMSTLCEGNMSTVYHRDIVFDQCNKNGNWISVIVIFIQTSNFYLN